MWKLFYCFLKKYIPEHCFELLESDTDSMYFAISRRSLDQGFLNYGSRNKLAFCALCHKTLKILIVPWNIAHVIGKLENLGTKIDKLELDSECEPFFREHLKLATIMSEDPFFFF